MIEVRANASLLSFLFEKKHCDFRRIIKGQLINENFIVEKVDESEKTA